MYGHRKKDCLKNKNNTNKKQNKNYYGISKNYKDTQLLLQEYSKLSKSITSKHGWSMLLAKYCSQPGSKLEYILDMVQIMILRDNLFPLKAIAPILRQVFIKARPDKSNFTNFNEQTMLIDIIISILYL